MIAAIAIVCLTPWVALNLHVFGDLTPGARGARITDTAPQPFVASFVPLDIAVFILSYWAGGPWGTLPFAGALAVLGGLIALMAPAGIIKELRSRTGAVAIGPLVVATATVVSMCGLALSLPITGHFEFVAPGRYAYPVLPAAASLCALGLCAVVTGALARRLVAAAYGALAAVMLVTGPVSVPPAAVGLVAPPSSARIVDVQAADEQDGFAIRVDRVALDETAHATWIEVSATNSGSAEAEWGVVPVATANGAVARGEYPKSTQLPGDVDPGGAVSGWIYVPLDPSAVRAGGSLTLRFENVAVNNYRTVRNFDLSVRLAGI